MGEPVPPEHPGADPAATTGPEPVATGDTESQSQALFGDFLGWFPGVVDRVYTGARTLVDVLIQVHVRLWTAQFTAGYSLIQSGIGQGAQVTWQMREQVCLNTGGERLVARIDVTPCTNGIQTVTPQGMPAQNQSCTGGTGGSYVSAPQCVYRDPTQKYLWDDGPSIPPAADALLGSPLLTGQYRSYAMMFWVAGQQHDYCYHHGRATYGYTRASCDDEFHATMRAICKADHPWWSAFNRQTCFNAAAVMYDAVKIAGTEAFNTTSTRVNYLRAHGTPGSHRVDIVGSPAYQVVADHSGRLYALSPDQQGTFMLPANSTRWEWIGTGAAKLVGADTLYSLAPSGTSINKFDPVAKTWSNIGGAAADFTVGIGGVFAFAPDRQSIWLRGTHTGVWSQVGGSGFYRFVSSDGQVYAVRNGNQGISRFDGSFNWTQVGGPGADWAVTSRGLLVGLAPDLSGVHAFVNGSWRQVGGPADSIFGGHPDVFAISPGDNQIMRIRVSSTGSMSDWVRVGGPASSLILSRGLDLSGKIWSISAWDNNIGLWSPL